MASPTVPPIVHLQAIIKYGKLCDELNTHLNEIGGSVEEVAADIKANELCNKTYEKARNSAEKFVKAQPWLMGCFGTFSTTCHVHTRHRVTCTLSSRQDVVCESTNTK